MRPLFFAPSTFDQTEPDWDQYKTWRGLPQLTEVVSIENHSILKATHTNAEDWAYIDQDSEVATRRFCFTDLGRLQSCLLRNGLAAPTLLCVFRQPEGPPQLPQLPLSFALLGYDLIEDRTCVSSVSNCKSFTAAFPDVEVTECCLIGAFEQARRMQEEMPRLFRGDPHAYCSLWAIFRGETGSARAV
jgi:hypothetical protein